MSEEVVGTTEQSSLYNDLEKMETMEILKSMNREDKSVPMAIEEACLCTFPFTSCNTQNNN